MKRNLKNAFTLIEIISVIVIIGVLLVMIFPLITSAPVISQAKFYESQQNSLYLSGRDYFTSDRTRLPKEINEQSIVTLNTLILEGYIKPIVDAKNKECDGDQSIVRVTNAGQGEYKYYSRLVCDNYDSANNNANAPVITLLGNNPVYINQNETYIDAGATATDDIDGDITDDIIIDNTVNNKVAGAYTITYNVVDSGGNAAEEITRTVYVNDITPPVITLLGDNLVSLSVGETYTDEGAIALDDTDGNITDDIVIVNNVNINVTGTYNVTYNVIDSAGNIATEVTRTVIVWDVDSTPPTAPVIARNIYYYTITPGTDSGSGVDRTTYILSGATTVSETTYTGNITISNVGTTTITAYTYDNADNRSTAATASVVVSEQTTCPSGYTWTGTTCQTTQPASSSTYCDSEIGQGTWSGDSCSNAPSTIYYSGVTCSGDINQDGPCSTSTISKDVENVRCPSSGENYVYEWEDGEYVTNESYCPSSNYSNLHYVCSLGSCSYCDSRPYSDSEGFSGTVSRDVTFPTYVSCSYTYHFTDGFCQRSCLVEHSWAYLKGTVYKTVATQNYKGTLSCNCTTVYSCPSGWTKIGSTCYSYTDPTCSVGATYSVETDKCYQ